MNLRILMILASLAAGTTQAGETMRCGKWVVDAEATLSELLSKCGEPAKKEVREEDVRAPGLQGRGTRIIGKTKTERWIYDRGSRSFHMVVTVVDGKVKSIDKAG